MRPATAEARVRSSTFDVEPSLGPLKGAGAREADDPAIWIHPEDASRSLIFTCDKKKGIYVYNLDGKQLQHVFFGTRLNNIDVRSGFQMGDTTIDILAANLRRAGKLAVLKINPDYTRDDALTILADQSSQGNSISPDSYGFALYKRSSDGAIFVFDKSKNSKPIRQWRLSVDSGRIRTTEVRRITDVEMGVAEGFAADDSLDLVYFAEERGCIHKYNADPDRGTQTRLSFFAVDDGIVGDREGLGLYMCSARAGFLVLSSQGNSTFKIYDRSGDHRLVASFRARKTHGTDGLEVCATPVPGFPHGFIVIHDEPSASYYVYDWSQIENGASLLCRD